MLRGWPSASKRAPIAASVASGHPSPDEEETVTTAPSGMRRAASACGNDLGPGHCCPQTVRSIGVSAPVRAAAAAESRDAQGLDAVLAGRRRRATSLNGVLKQADRARVQVLVIELERLLASGGPQEHIALRRLRHAVAANQRACLSMHLEAGRCIFGGEAIVKLRQHAVREADDAHGPVLQPLAAHAAVRGHGHNRFRLVVEDESKRVGVVNGDVENDSAARVRALEPPALQVGRQIDGVEHPREKRLADPSRFDRLPHRAMRRRVAEVVIGPHDDSALAAFRDHRARVLERQRERLLA